MSIPKSITAMQEIIGGGVCGKLMKVKTLGFHPKPQKLLKKFHQNFDFNIKVFAPLFSKSGWEFEGEALKVVFMCLSWIENLFRLRRKFSADTI